MGVALSEERKFEEAAESYQAAINSKHQEWGAKSANNLSLLLQNNGYIDHARLLAEHALSFSDQRWAISLNVLLGDIYIKLADRDRSIIHYHNAKQLSDDVSRTTEELFVKHGAESVDARGTGFGLFAPGFRTDRRAETRIYCDFVTASAVIRQASVPIVGVRDLRRGGLASPQGLLSEFTVDLNGPPVTGS